MLPFYSPPIFQVLGKQLQILSDVDAAVSREIKRPLSPAETPDP